MSLTIHLDNTTGATHPRTLNAGDTLHLTVQNEEGAQVRVQFNLQDDGLHLAIRPLLVGERPDEKPTVSQPDPLLVAMQKRKPRWSDET